MTRGPLEGRVAVVTGAVGRLGPLWLDALTGAGAVTVALVLPGTAHDPSLRDRPGGDEQAVVEADVRNRSSLVAALQHVQRSWGAPQVLVNNAGIDQPPAPGRGTALEDVDDIGFLGVLDVNLVGTFRAMQVFGGAMADAGRGSIVNVGSLYASVSPDTRMYDHIPMDPPFLKPPAYGASKAGVVNLTRFFAAHWASKGVRVNAISPGGVEGGQDPQFREKFSARVPLGRLARPDELGQPLVFLASDASSYITGINLKVDGGFTVW